MIICRIPARRPTLKELLKGGFSSKPTPLKNDRLGSQALRLAIRASTKGVDT
jgi:hypothetical protein